MEMLVLLIILAGVASGQDGSYMLDSRGVQIQQGLVPPSKLLQKHQEYSQAKPTVYNALGDTVPQYAWAYEVHSDSTGDHKAAREERRGDFVQGQYTVVDPDGLLRVVDYSVAPGRGFQATVNKATPEQSHYSRVSGSHQFSSQFSRGSGVQQYSRDHFRGQATPEQSQYSRVSGARQFSNPFSGGSGVQQYSSDHSRRQEQGRLQKQEKFPDQQLRQYQIQNQFSQGQFQNEGLQDRFQSQARSQGHRFSQFQNKQTFRGEFQEQEEKLKEIQGQQNFQGFQDQQRRFQEQQRGFQDQRRGFQQTDLRGQGSQGARFEEIVGTAVHTSVPATHIVLKNTFDGSDDQEHKSSPQALSRDPNSNQATRSSFDGEHFNQQLHNHPSAKFRDSSSTEFQKKLAIERDSQRQYLTSSMPDSSQNPNAIISAQ